MLVANPGSQKLKIAHIKVDTEHQGQGVASMLLLGHNLETCAVFL